MRGYGGEILGALLIILFSVLPAVASGGGTAEKGTPYFTNKDIEKYSMPSDRQQEVSEEKHPKTTVHAKETAKEKEKEHWCKKASSAKKVMDKKQDRITELEREISERRGRGVSGGKTEKSLQKRLAKAKREHGYAEKNYEEIAEEAHRKGIPPGWLRCQFE
jgi:hypothetical protein